jgi:MFS family permease
MAILSKDEKRKAHEGKELARLKKEKARPKNKIYFWYLLLILALIYIIDECITNSPSQLEDGLVSSFFFHNGAAGWYDSGVSKLSLLSTASIALMIPSCFYKPLADRYGRKIFLFINTAGMALSILICFSAYYAGDAAFWIYALGFCLMRWFVTPDEQVVYIMETAPKKWRGTINSLVKGLAEFGLFLIPWFRNLFMSNNEGGWRFVFLTLAIIGFVVAFLVLLFARESDVFLDERIGYLELSDEQKKALEEQKLNNKKKQGGLLAGLAYAFKDKQLRWLFICTTLYTIARAVTDRDTSIMAQAWLLADGSNKTSVQALITQAQFILPVGAGIVTLISGFLGDWIGRKKASIVLLSSCTVFFVLYVVGVQYTWNIYLIGSFLGLYLASYWVTGDTYIMMVGESSPTNLRASIMSAQSAFYGLGQGISYGLTAAIFGINKNLNIGWTCLIFALPFFVLTLTFLMLKVKETKATEITEADAAVNQEEKALIETPKKEER